MTGEAHSRVGLLGSTCVETIFALYGLNMVGADVSVVPTYSALMPKRIIQTIRDERLPGFSWERVKRADIALPQGALPSPCAQLPGALPSP